jgi:carbon dioxide concentrating mechanism protein CcmO
MAEAERIGQLHAVMVIPRLLEDLESTLPIASFWLEKPETLPMLMPKQKERVALPELEKTRTPLKVQKDRQIDLEL